MTNEGFKEEFENHMTFAAFNAWQINETIKAALGGKNHKPVTFTKYLENIGLTKPEKSQTNKAERERQKEQALETAQNIVELYKKGRE